MSLLEWVISRYQITRVIFLPLFRLFYRTIATRNSNEATFLFLSVANYFCADYETSQAYTYRSRHQCDNVAEERSCRGFKEKLWSTALGFPRAAVMDNEKSNRLDDNCLQTYVNSRLSFPFVRVSARNLPMLAMLIRFLDAPNSSFLLSFRREFPVYPCSPWPATFPPTNRVPGIHPILIARVVRATPERPRVLLSLFLFSSFAFFSPNGIGQIRFSFYNSTKPFGIAISSTAEEEPQLEIRSWLGVRFPFFPCNPFLMFPYFSLHPRSLSFSLSPLLVVSTVARRAIRESGKLDKARTGNGIEAEPGH